jgi:hypothetical protein
MLNHLLAAKGKEAGMYLLMGVAILVTLWAMPSEFISFLLRMASAVACILYVNHVWGERLISLVRGKHDGIESIEPTPTKGEQGD